MIQGAPIQRLSSTVNAAVVQLPERKHPGVVIQADSLRNLSSLIDEVSARIDAGDTVEASSVLTELRQIVGGYLDSVDNVLRATNPDQAS